MRRVAVLLPVTADDPDSQARLGAFLQGLQEAGWSIGRNMRIDTRWAGSNANDIRRHAAELVVLAPDVILAYGTSTVRPLLQATRTVPIVFPVAGDPVGGGLVESLARPGGNVTGFMTTEYTVGGKWLELLKEIAPSVTHLAVLRDPTQGSGTSQFAVIQALAPSFRVQVNPVSTREAAEIDRSVAALARSPNGGLIATAGAASLVHRDRIIGLVAAGGLVSYGADYIDQFRRAASYVTASSRARKLPTCRCKRQPSSSWQSTLKPRRPSAPTCRRRCSPAPTR
jgi:putative ABC transport system substrate-binding protein